MITVGELIKELEKYDKDLPVATYDHEWGYGFVESTDKKMVDVINIFAGTEEVREAVVVT